MTRSAVLVVEDDFLIRMQAADMVEAAGFHSIEARNADDAIAILETRDDIRVIFTDIQMPGSIDGLRLAHVVRHRWPPIAIIATSATDVTLDDLPAGGHFIAKPYSLADVGMHLRQVTADQ
ncbi:response regulator [Bradyrhizobium sp. Pear77]|uniref:response regulator n=1 Tax=Bradyrhizobium altum TaxID=1571202 RepID=UPI001E3CAEF9|nr:response regulator [Bradyrhizobium altum]MCC8956410.1 response regulator [Bradyrhizobium altum]